MEYNSMDENVLLHDRAMKLSKPKVHVHFDIVLCLGKMTNILSRESTGKEKKKGTWNTMDIVNWTETTENQSSVCGIISQDTQH